MTLRRKLLLWYSGVFFVSAAVLVGSMYWLIAHKLRRDFLHYLGDEYAQAQHIAGENLNDEEELRRDVEMEVQGRKYFPLSYEVYDTAQGRYLVRLAPEWPDALPAHMDCENLGTAPRLSTAQFGDDPGEVVYLMTGWLQGSADPGVVVRVGMSYERTFERLDDLGEYLMYALVASVLLSVVGSSFLASRSLDPVDEIASSLERIQAAGLSARLPEAEPADEIGRIVSSANRMLARLEESFEQVRRFAGDVAHELRTPLSALRCRLELALGEEGLSEESRAAMGDALHDVDELAALVNNLLFLASLDAADRPEQPERVQLAGLVENVREVFGVLADQGGLELEIDVGDDCSVHGDRTLLHRLLCNLIENAIRYTPPGGRVEVRAGREDGLCRISVSDTGIGIGPADIDRIFDRFYRAEDSRSRGTGGTGLGLSICRRIVELHGGTIAAESEKGKGTVVTAALPAD